jgi:hypothetical protein
MSQRPGAAVGQRWWLKAALVAALMVPPVVARGFDARQSSTIVREVLMHPIVVDYEALVVLAKYALLAVMVVCLVWPSLLGRVGWGYYAVVLVVMAVGQNVAVTADYGLAWLAGNTLLLLVVAGFAAHDARAGLTRGRPSTLRRGRLWVLVPMFLAWWFPYVVQGGVVRPGPGVHALVNESGLTYCMVTPIILGLMILHSEGVHASTLAVAAWVGLLFGVTNALTWFVLDAASWWMGILHLPLLLLAGYGAWLSRRPRARSARAV